MINKTKSLMASGVAIALAGFYMGSFAQAKGEDNTVKNSQQISKEKLDAYIKFTKILNLIEHEYVDDVNTTTLVNKALKGMVSNLDAHSSYMTKDEYKDLNVHTKGEFGGLGLSVGMRDNAVTVIAPIKDTPAYKAGIKAGDLILKIDGIATMGMDIDAAVKLMRGKPKTKIILTIVRKDQPKPIDFTITRDIIKIQSVFSKSISDEILYIQVTSFDQNVVKEVQKVIKNNPHIKGVVLDLRNNPGGLLDQAIGLTDIFVDSGVIVSQKGRAKGENITYKAKSGGIETDVPVVVLVNGGSASASEIVSGALQDLDRAVVVGEKTFGKGSVQAVLPIGNDEGLRLTIARYYLPSGRSIQAKGVEPNIIVHAGAISTQEESAMIKENELTGHLKNGDDKKQEPKREERNSGKSDDTKISETELYKDAQLKSSVDILKALMITKKGK